MVPRLFTQGTGSDPVPGREGLFYSAGDPMSGRAGVRDGENCSRMERPPWMQRLAPLYVVALRIALAAAAGTTIQPRLPSRSTASVSRIATPAASADLCQASSIPPGLCVDSGPKAIRRLSRAENTG